ncbi:MAG: Alpha-galactosidase [Phycisphaerae bacterium]|nr:Alpha-galactosidase [Phycisphaerae bacterium]
MAKIVFMGAGSAFAPRLFKDIVQTEGVGGGEYCLVDIDARRLKPMAQLSRKVLAKLRKDKRWKVTATTKRREVLKDADFVISCIEVAGTHTVRFDNDIPLKYGIKQCIGDTIGPGGIFKAMRTVPAWLDILADVERLCPDALVMNYTNPMSIMMLATVRSRRVQSVGLCHSVQGTGKLLARCAGVPYEEMKWQCAGVNHFAWFTELSHNGRDLYPVLRKAMKNPEVYEKDPVRFDMMEHFGAFVTESSGHFSEYLPYYRKRDDLLAKYCREGYRGGTSFYADNWPTWRKDLDAKVRRQLAGKEKIDLAKSHEYACTIIGAAVTGVPATIHANVSNAGGLIENLPADGIVEVETVVDRTGYHPTRFGRLPDQLAALCRTNMNVYELAAQACIEKDLRKAEYALMLDPLTAAVCSPAEVRRMFREMVSAEKKWLPGFKYRG